MDRFDHAHQLYQAGDLFAAYDILQHWFDDELAQGRDGAEGGYLLTLLLANLGNCEEALRSFKKHQLANSEDLDTQALEARIWKDIGFSNRGAARNQYLTHSRDIYRALGEAKADSFTLINAATLSSVIGQTSEAHRLAQSALDHAPDNSTASYWTRVTRMEANIVLGEYKQAAVDAGIAARLDDATSSARASTIRQLLRLADAQKWDAEHRETLIDPLRPSAVLHFLGHIFSENSGKERLLRRQIDDWLHDRKIAVAYGCPAAGSDILVAEALLDYGAELHIVVPFAQDNFISVSVAPAGQSWIKRFEKVLAAATSVTFASTMEYVDDTNQFAYGARVAMGLTHLRAGLLFTDAIQLAIWDRQPARGNTGTAIDIETWKDTGGATSVVEGDNLPRPEFLKADNSGRPDQIRYPRGTKAILFTDFPGYSRLSENQLPIFQREIMDRCGAVLSRYTDRIRAKNSWGDALFVVMDDAAEAAEMCLALQAELAQADFAALGLKELTSMRFALHFGPVYSTDDSLQGRRNYFGNEVNRAARLEPCTPPGTIYVTEPFAASLSMTKKLDFILNYVGEIDLAKAYGKFPVYQLSRTQ